MNDKAEPDYEAEYIKKFESTIRLLEYEVEAINSHCTMALNKYCKLHAKFRIQQEELSESLTINLEHEMKISELTAAIEGIEESLAYENINNDSLSVTIDKQVETIVRQGHVIESLKKASLAHEDVIARQHMEINPLQEQLSGQALPHGPPEAPE